MKKTTKQIATLLSQALPGMLPLDQKVFKFTDADDCVDGEVAITDRITVQVGFDYVVINLVYEGEDEYNFYMKTYPERKTIEALVKDILNATKK